MDYGPAIGEAMKELFYSLFVRYWWAWPWIIGFLVFEVVIRRASRRRRRSRN